MRDCHEFDGCVHLFNTTQGDTGMPQSDECLFIHMLIKRLMLRDKVIQYSPITKHINEHI